ncbi:Na(+)/H(+) antiporter subunit F1 [Aciduricibacillus chroicocephali]|uniref:Na(+)/H(+) antiporter subunit F1 n=1 Tax=Aciduricibacillus chroicocephali TaxID=3054939 RepID=A0ABY9KSA5_9BACI|nr:Na(+)/H(+) antiporter subunit F1 [Bacillaceae bacterium 44XB]
MNDLLLLTEKVMHIAVSISVIGISISLLLLLYRVMIGPTNPDRAVGLDLIGINLMGIAALAAIMLASDKLNDVILLIGILSFIGTVGISKYLEKGVLIDRDFD